MKTEGDVREDEGRVSPSKAENGATGVLASAPGEVAAMLEARYSEQARSSHAAGQLLSATGPRTWAMFLCAMSMVAALVVVSVTGRVEVSSAGVGRVRVRGGMVAVHSPGSGTVSAVLVRAGDAVSAGRPIVSLGPSREGGEPSDVVASHPGVIEAVSAHVGEVVDTGRVLARLMPSDESLEVVATIPERDRGFAQVGQEISLEADQLPPGELGSLHAKIVRIASDLASREDLVEAFGDLPVEGPVYLVYLDLLPDERRTRVGSYVRPGMLVTARYTLRTRRAIGLVLDPLGRWLD